MSLVNKVAGLKTVKRLLKASAMFIITTIYFCCKTNKDSNHSHRKVSSDCVQMKQLFDFLLYFKLAKFVEY